MTKTEIATATREQLQDNLRALSLAVSGKVEELRQRLSEELYPEPVAAVPVAVAAVPEVAPAPMPIITCPGCGKTSRDRMSSAGKEQCVTAYATTTYTKFRVRYCKCRNCGRVWKERAPR